MLLEIPEKVENLLLPAPELLNYYQDLEDRIIWITGEIDEYIIEFSKKILHWNKEDKNVSVDERIPIRLLIFSPGGCLYSALSLINIIELSKTPVYTYSMGESSSAGLYILLAGHKRYALKDTTAILHKGAALLGGNANQVEASAKWYKQQLNRLKEYVLEKTTLDVRTYNKRQDEDWYLDCDNLLKYEFVNGIIDNIEMIIGS
jgi:ATP-dependent Clp protease protease subunit